MAVAVEQAPAPLAGPRNLEAELRSGLAGVRVVALALASCATIPRPHDASDTVLMLRKYDAWAWAAGVALICAGLVLPVPQIVVIAALGIIYASVLGVLLSAPLSGLGIGIRQLGVKPRHPFTETGMTGFSAEPSRPRPAAHWRVCPSGPIGQPPRLAELGVGSCRSGPISARLPIQPMGSTWAKLRTGVSSPNRHKLATVCEREGGPVDAGGGR